MAFRLQKWLLVYKTCISSTKVAFRFTNIQLSITKMAFQLTKWHLILHVSISVLPLILLLLSFSQYEKYLSLNNK